MTITAGYRLKLARAPACVALALLAVVAAPCVAAEDELTASVSTDGTEFYIGESFTMQVNVSGSDSPDRPDMSGLTDFTVQEVGIQPQNRSSTTIVNGRVSRQVFRGCTIVYKLTPKRTGTLTIPALEVAARGRRAVTSPVQVRVQKPEESEDFKLRLSLSRARCYVGEPVTLRAVWYVGKTVRNFEVTIPVLSNDSFAFANPQDGQYSKVQTPGGEVAALQNKQVLDGKQYDAVTFAKVLIPKKPGVFQIDPVTVVCAVLAGVERQRSPFGDDFPFGLGNREVYKKVAVSSGGASLEVLPLPETGRPAGFAGHVGEYRVTASATPADVNVGDPITLTVAVSGPEYLDDVELPPLDRQPALARDFKIPKEIAPGKTAGGAKVFTQTVRAMREDVQAIPPIELPYFDTRAGEYRVAKSAPIPIKVKATRVVTTGIGDGGTAPVAGNPLEVLGKGIAYNYDDQGVLEDQSSGPAVWIRSPLRIAIVTAPPLAYFAVLVCAVAVRRRNADPLALKARKAFGVFMRACRGAAGGRCAPALLEAMRVYLGSRLRMPSAALSYADVEAPLLGRAVTRETLGELRLFFEACEAASYAGGSGAATDPSSLAEKATTIAGRIEKEFR